MAWEWVGPASTAVVAVMGTGATAWTARLNFRSQRELASDQTAEERRTTLRTERRQAYLALLEEERKTLVDSRLPIEQSFFVACVRRTDGATSPGAT